MKQEDKDLLLRDLSARLTYGVKVVRYIERNNKVEQLIPEMDLSLRLFELSISNQWFIIKPYLRPISSLTDEEKIELQKAFNIKLSNAATQLAKAIPIVFFLHCSIFTNIVYKN